MLDREDSPWYPTLRLFRQARLDDWHEVVVRAASVLSRWTPRIELPAVLATIRESK